MQLDEAKAPSQPFKVRCPKCQTSVSVQRPAASPEPVASEVFHLPDTPAAAWASSPFERPAAAPPFKPDGEDQNADLPAQSPSIGMNDVAKLLAEALRHADSGSSRSRGRKRPAWDRRKVLVCGSPAYREAIARSLPDQDYEV
ncbi:MAG TPA: hypothetical protein VHD88_08195, partial [Pyrinomonadaceae bacterium]|nr:hypothetical protein [Pyrinomonadaceae bacterium]